MIAAIFVFQLSLADAQTRAVANDVTVQTTRAAVRSREAALGLARGAAIPHLTGEYSLAPQAGPLDSGTVEQHYFAVAAGISLNDLIANSAAIRGASAELLAGQRDAEAAELSARENAAKLYFAALQATAVERARADAVRGAQRDRAAADLRARSGEAPQLDVVRADVTLAQARADLSRAQADRANAVDALASATNLDPAEFANVSISTPPLVTLARMDLVVARALAARPELASLIAQIDARQADVLAARQSAIPNATLDAGYQKGVDTGIPVQGPQVLAHVDVPLAPGTSERIAQAQTQVDAAQAQLVDERRKIVLEAKAAVRDALADAAALEAAERARAEADRALAAVEIGYREGASSSLDVAEARRTDTQAEVDALVAAYQLALAQAIVSVVAP